MKHTATQACAANQERKKIMSKRSRGQVALDKIRAKSEASKSVADTMSPHKTANSEVKSPLKKLMESPAVGKLADKSSLKLSPTRFDETVSALISKFKSISNVLLSLQSRRKMSTWETVVESYQTISSDALTLDDLLIILSIWNEAFSTRWQPRTFDAKQNARTFELIVEIPASSTPSDTITIEDNAPGSSSNQPAASVESTSLLRALRITTFADKVYALVTKAVESDSTELDLFPDPAKLPPQPAVASPSSNSSNKRLRSEAPSNDIADWAQDILNAKPVGDNLTVTLDVLRARAIERGRQAQIKADILLTQIQQEDLNKLLTLLPLITDTLRSLSVRKNRTRMPKKDCVDAVVKAMHLKAHDVLQGFDKIYAVVPEFLEILPAEAASPATVHINTAISYKDVRSKVVEYARNNAKSTC